MGGYLKYIGKFDANWMACLKRHLKREAKLCTFSNHGNLRKNRCYKIKKTQNNVYYFKGQESICNREV